MKNNRIKYYLFFLCVLLIKTQFACAAETFHNNLLKADLSPSSLGGVKIILYTSKPYSEPIVVNKKSDYEYVILMPETSNSLTAKPALKAVSGIINNVEVKTQQYDNQVKGYTKIIISTAKPISITSQVQVVSASESLGEKEYRNLIAQAAKTTTNTNQKEIKKVLSEKKTAPKFVQAPKTLQPQHTVQPQKVHAAGKKHSQAVVKNIASKAAPVKQVSVSKPHVKIKSKAESKIVQAPSVKGQKISIPVQKKPVSSITTTTASTQTPIQSPKINVQPQKVVSVDNSIKAKVFRKFEKYKTVIKNNLYIALGSVIVVLFLLLLGASKMFKNIQKQKEAFASNLDEMPVPVTDYTQKINDDMTWKEKFQTYVEATQNVEDSSPKVDVDLSNSELDNLVNEESFEEISEMSFKKEGSKNLSKSDVAENSIFNELSEKNYTEPKRISESDIWGEIGNQYTEEEKEVSLDYLFGEDEISDTNVFIHDDKIGEDLKAFANTFIKSEFAIDNEKGFYLVDYEDATALVGHIAEEVFVLKRFDSRIRGDIQARLNERKPNSVSYMTRVGNFRGVVEVTPHNMNLLIEL